MDNFHSSAGVRNASRYTKISKGRSRGEKQEAEQGRRVLLLRLDRLREEVNVVDGPVEERAGERGEKRVEADVFFLRELISPEAAEEESFPLSLEDRDEDEVEEDREDD
jgi:hypothetical protein